MSAPALIVLALNSGSSSLKFGLFRIDAMAPSLLIGGEADTIGAPTLRMGASCSAKPG